MQIQDTFDSKDLTMDPDAELMEVRVDPQPGANDNTIPMEERNRTLR